MFKYSVDEYIASEQKQQATKLIKELKEKAPLVYSHEIEAACEKEPFSFNYLQDLVDLTKACNDRIVVPSIPRTKENSSAQFDMRQGFLISGKSWTDTIPYIEYSFPYEYNCPHGYDYLNVYLLFFTKYHDYEGSRDCVLYYLNKLSKLKAFV